MKVSLVTTEDRKYSILKTIEMPCRPIEGDFLIIDAEIYFAKRIWIMDSFIGVLVVPARDDVESIRNSLQTKK